ncbi:HIT family protein [Amycolatopsis eburnea]|uniref:hypothetical protein n=1 Tax=Amycolatopsis eburnea TaxID=2267691 RepID=UPI0013159624|nr:hypothetical protein [Amycolatopsis eburnea]
MVTSEHGAAPVHSVLLYASGHDVILADLSPQRLTRLLRRIAEHTRLLMTGGCAAVYVFEVHGDVLGPTVAHPHGQILGFSFVPDKMTRLGRPCALCAAADMAALRLIELETVEFGVSQWSRLPFEMLIYPRRHISELGQCTNAELRDLAAGLHHALRLIGDPAVPYILNIMQVSPSKAGEHHLRIELVPFNKPNGTLKMAGACELFLGIYINPVDPVRAAALLRQRLAR